MKTRKIILPIAAAFALSTGLSCAQSMDAVFQDLDSFVKYYSDLPSTVEENKQPLVVSKKMSTEMEFPKIQVGTEFQAAMMLQFAKDQLGKSYRFGASGPDEFDCSGFIYYVFDQAGKKIARTSKEQGEGGVIVERDQLKAGDLVFFDTRSSVNPKDIRIDKKDVFALFDEVEETDEWSPSRITHSGIYLGEGKFIHASSGDVMKVVVEDLGGEYFDQRFVVAKRY